MTSSRISELAQKYCLQLAAAFVRGKLADPPPLPDADLVQFGLEQGLRLHKFKRSSALPRVRKVLGILQGIVPENLLDIGSGRGVFLWPLLDQFPDLPVQSIDQRQDRIDDIQAVARGGYSRLRGDVMDVCKMTFADASKDVVTALEVLEHLEQPEQATREIVRVARRFVIASVPSKEDDNPEHIQLFTGSSLESMLLKAGAVKVRIEYVLNHIIAVAKVAKDAADP